MWERTAIVGIVMAAGVLYMFDWEFGRADSLIEAQSVALTTLVLFEVFQAGNARSENRSLFGLNPLANPFLFWASLAALSLHIAAMHLPAFQYVLSIEPISGAAWVRTVIVAATILVAVEAHKAVRRRWPIGGTSARPPGSVAEPD